jgi:hypothetical protein
MVEEGTNVRIEHPVHPPRGDPHTERIERLVGTPTRPEPVGEPLEVPVVDLVEDDHHSVLDELVLQRRDAQRPLPPVGLRDVDSP